MDRFDTGRVGPETPSSDSFSVVESSTVDQQRHDGETSNATPEGEENATHAGLYRDDRAPYAVRLRMILALSLASWALVLIVVAYLIGWL